jgi:hypothetical protein
MLQPQQTLFQCGGGRRDVAASASLTTGLLLGVNGVARTDVHTISNKIDGDAVISEPTLITGLISGSLFVKSGATVQLSGLVVGNVCISADASVTISGTVNGTVINEGGEATILGFVGGIRATPGSETHVLPKAVVRNR